MDLVIMTFQQSDLNEDVEGEGKGFGNDQGVSLKCLLLHPLIRPSGTFSLEGEDFPSLFETGGFCNSG